VNNFQANAGWYPDPSGKGELRYFNGSEWTSRISIKGVVYESPLASNSVGNQANQHSGDASVPKSGNFTEWFKDNKPVAILLGVILGSFLICVLSAGIVAIANSDAQNTEKVTTAKEPATTTTSKPISANQKLSDSIKKALGKSNRGIKTRVKVTGPENGGDITVTWAINDNLTEGLIKDAARIEARDILEEVAKSKVDYKFVNLNGTFELVDQLGNAAETEVVNTIYSKEIVDKINFENFNFKNVFDIDPTAFIHPTFEY